MAESTLLLGMQNPLSLRPDMALYPAPEGCTGWRVWRMLTEASERAGHGPVSRNSYIHGFHRRNLVDGERWSVREARRGWAQLCADGVADSCHNLLLVGAEVQRIVMGSRPHPILGQATDHIWCIPHPSGRNRMYNDPEVRECASDILLQLYRRGV